MYQNETLNNSQTGAGKAYVSPTVSVSITVGDPTPPEPEVVWGDLSGDGKITSMDLLLLRKYLKGETELDKRQIEAADLNDDGKLTTMDLLLLRKYLAGEIDDFRQKNNGCIWDLPSYLQ